MNEWIVQHRGGSLPADPGPSTYYEHIRSAYAAHERGAKCERAFREVRLVELPRQPEEPEARAAFVWVRRQGDPAVARTAEERRSFEEGKEDRRAKKLLERVLGRKFGPWFRTSFGLRRASLGGDISSEAS